MGDENSWRGGDGSFGAGRDALERACATRVAGTPQSSKRVDFSGGVRVINHHWLWSLLRGRRKTARVDEFDSSRYRPGFANLIADSYPSRKEDTSYGLELNFKLRMGAGYSIFTLPLWERPAFGNLVYGRNNRIGT